mmetsp:Transcript_12544/g.35443  ORF Transcript_12544/g.35443 Transcript_12544/m.35443 type:complete len:283 (+) Transcript_12544:204-1052(+)
MLLLLWKSSYASWLGILKMVSVPPESERAKRVILERILCAKPLDAPIRKGCEQLRRLSNVRRGSCTRPAYKLLLDTLNLRTRTPLLWRSRSLSFPRDASIHCIIAATCASTAETAPSPTMPAGNLATAMRSRRSSHGSKPREPKTVSLTPLLAARTSWYSRFTSFRPYKVGMRSKSAAICATAATDMPWCVTWTAVRRSSGDLVWLRSSRSCVAYWSNMSRRGRFSLYHSCESWREARWRGACERFRRGQADPADRTRCCGDTASSGSTWGLASSCFGSGFA